MAAQIADHPSFVHESREFVVQVPSALRYAVPVGRVLFALIFLLSVPRLFTAQSTAYAASQGVPLASVAVPIAGLLALIGGFSVALGIKTRIGALLLVVFLVPVTLMMHRFWGLSDPQAAMLQQAHFMKNIALLGSALLVCYFGGGPFSLDARSAAVGTAQARARS